MNNQIFSSKAIIIIGLLILAGGIFFGSKILGRGDMNEGVDSGEQKVVVHKSPTCGCCVKYIAYLKRKGFEVETVNNNDLDLVKQEYGIPYDMQSCHTADFGDYIVEGHVPIDAVEKLLTERPDIDGIGLAGMPAGSPGMPGVKIEEFGIYSLVDGEVGDFMVI